MSKNIFGTEYKLTTETVHSGGGSVVVTEYTDHDYHQYVTRYFAQKRDDESDDDDKDAAAIADENRDVNLRLLAVSLMPGTGCNFDDLYKDLSTPGNYSKKEIRRLFDAMQRVNGIEGNSQTATSE